MGDAFLKYSELYWYKDKNFFCQQSLQQHNMGSHIRGKESE